MGRPRIFCFIVVDTDEGISGVGEVGITARELGVVGIVEHFKPLLIGQDPARIEHINQMLTRGGFYPAKHIVNGAISAIDIALWDIKGKALGVPVYELFGGRVRDRVICYPHNRGDSTEITSLVESCLQTKEEGWKFVRWGLPSDNVTLEPREAVRLAVKQVEAVRMAIGDEIEICFDVHTRLDLPDAVTLCRALEPYDLFFVEDPLRSENPDSFKTLRPRTIVPLAAGEQFNSKWEFRELIEAEWIDYARIDLGIIGGFTEARKVAGWCETHYIKLALHNPLAPWRRRLACNCTLPHRISACMSSPLAPARHCSMSSRCSRSGKTGISYRRHGPVSASNSIAKRRRTIPSKCSSARTCVAVTDRSRIGDPDGRRLGALLAVGAMQKVPHESYQSIAGMKVIQMSYGERVQVP